MRSLSTCIRLVASCLIFVVFFFCSSSKIFAWDVTSGGDHNGQDWIVTTNTEVAGYHYNIGLFKVNSGVTLTVRPFNGTSYGNFSVSSVTNDIRGIINGNSAGYLGGISGADSPYPGGGQGWNGACGGAGATAGGGGHGGNGGTGGGPYPAQVWLGGGAFGDMLAPTTMGGGGGGGNRYGCDNGGSGGAAIKLETSGEASISGSIVTNGGTGTYAGGGAGGSVYIIADTIIGGGTITANGGTGSNVGGAGGRIAFHYRTSMNFTGPVSANAGAGENGTIVYVNDTYNDLLIKNSQVWHASPSAEGFLKTFRDVTIQNNSTVTIAGYYTTNSDGRGMAFNVRDFLIATGSAITANYKGYAGDRGDFGGGLGPGRGLSNEVCSVVTGNAGGGGYGGKGGTSNDGLAAGGSTYGSMTEPISLGSGGGSADRYGCVKAGNGGGAIKIKSSGTISIWGTISANGEYQAWAAGGSGGSLFMIANNFAGTGTVQANGGNGGGASAGGGGGRIAMYYSGANSYTGTPTTTKGTQGNPLPDNGTINIAGIPLVPSNLSQKGSDAITDIAIGSAVTETTLTFTASVSASISMTVYPQIELAKVGTNFTGFPTATGSAVTSVTSTKGSSITVSGLTEHLAQYHWQYRSCNSDFVCSDWVTFGGNQESAVDFSLFLNQAPYKPLISSASADLKYVDGSFGHDSTPTLNFTLSDPDITNSLKYRIQISNNSDYSSPVVDYTSALGSQGATSFTVGQLDVGGTYLTGFAGQTLSGGNYYWRIMATDNNSATSDWATASLSNPAFKVDLNSPGSNATSFSGVTSGNWIKESPNITWNDAVDLGSGVLGYCVSLREENIGDPINISDPSTDSGILQGLDDGVSQTECPYIVTSSSFNPSLISGLSLTANKQYYFSIKAINTAGNIFSSMDESTYSNVVNFKYDNVGPTSVTSISGAGGSFSNINDMYFSWPTNQATDSGSGLLGYQYSINSQSDWTGTETDLTTGQKYIPIDYSQPFYLNSTRDKPLVIVGDNTIYFRAIDKIGNTSLPATYRTCSISYGGEAPAFTGDAVMTITPSVSTSNNYSLSWPDASPSTGRTITKYYYMVNTAPPLTLTTIKGNSAVYIPTTSTSVATSPLPGIRRGTNYVYVVPIDDNENYSPSNYLRSSLTLNSENPDPPVNLAASDASLKASSLWRGSLAWGEPDYKGTGDLQYRIQRSTDGVSWINVATTSGTAYVDTVPQSKKYYWRVGTTDSSDISIADPSWANAVTLLPKGSYTTPADLSSGPSVSNITTRKAKISWSTGRTADSKVAYGTETGKYYDVEASSSLPVTDHVISLTNLLPGTTYYYVTKWTDEDGNTGVSSEKSFTTSPAPSISIVKESDVSLFSALITFTVKDASKATLYYGKTSSYGGAVETNTSTSETTYSVKLEDLTDGTDYHYKLSLEDSEGGVYDFEDHLFTTLPRPKISSVQIQQVANTSQSTLYVTWKSNTEISSIITFYPDGKPEQARDEVNVALSKDHQTIIRSLLPDTTYILQIKGRDRVGNEGTSDRLTFTTATDTRPPEVIGVRAEGGEVIQSAENSQDVVSQLIVSWNTDEPSTSQVEFGEGTGTDYPQKTQEDSNLTMNHMVIISNLSPSKVYHLRAISKDKADNIGKSLDMVTITPKITDSAFGLVVTNLQEAFGFLGGIK